MNDELNNIRNHMNVDVWHHFPFHEACHAVVAETLKLRVEKIESNETKLYIQREKSSLDEFTDSELIKHGIILCAGIVAEGSKNSSYCRTDLNGAYYTIGWFTRRCIDRDVRLTLVRSLKSFNEERILDKWIGSAEKIINNNLNVITKLTEILNENGPMCAEKISSFFSQEEVK